MYFNNKYNIHNFKEYFSKKIDNLFTMSRKKNYGGTKKELKKSYKDIEKRIDELQKELDNHPLNELIMLEEERDNCIKAKRLFQKEANRRSIYFFQGNDGNLLWCPAKPILVSEEESEDNTTKDVCGWKSSKKGFNYAIHGIWPDGYILPKDFPSYIPGNWKESLIEPKEPREEGWRD